MIPRDHVSLGGGLRRLPTFTLDSSEVSPDPVLDAKDILILVRTFFLKRNLRYDDTITRCYGVGAAVFLFECPHSC